MGRHAAIPDPAARPVLGAEEAFRLLGIGRTAGYEHIRQGTFPIEVLRLGRVIKVPTMPLLAALGLAPVAAASPTND